MIQSTYSPATGPLPIYNARCGLREKVAGQLLDRWDLVYVDVRYTGGVVQRDADGYLPHLQYKPQYALTEEDRGEFILTGNKTDPPVIRFDPAPFFAKVAGSIVLTGGSGNATYDVRVLLKRFTRQFPLRHTLTVGTTAARLPRPFGASGLWIPSGANNTSLSLGGLVVNCAQPNGGFAACGPFDFCTFQPDQFVTFEVILPW